MSLGLTPIELFSSAQTITYRVSSDQPEYVRNLLEQVTFEWHVTTPDFPDHLLFEPDSHSLSKGQHATDNTSSRLTAAHLPATPADKKLLNQAYITQPWRVRSTPTAKGVRPTVTARPRILTVGRLVRRKGFEDVIRALAAIPEAELLIVGGPSRDMLDEHLEVRRLREQATECQVSDRVQFVGRIPQDEMPLLYRSADVVISYPWYEPFGIVPLEAMACGVPVVVSRVGGMTDTVIHGRTGQHVAPRRPDLLGDATRTLLTDRIQRAVYGTAGRRRMELHYDWDQVVKQMEQVYSDVFRTRQIVRQRTIGGMYNPHLDPRQYAQR